MSVEDLINLIDEIVDDKFELDESTPLIGGNSSIDSMNLVQICIALEDKSEEDGFTFDWQSEKAMSVMNSIFKNPKALANEYNQQMRIAKEK
tara:strand:- start:1 stop:276 length:276 start_codon:yes stop_codon:yes gene_type:complete